MRVCEDKETKRKAYLGRLKAERERIDNALKTHSPKSRWIYGYRDGLDYAISEMEGIYGN